MYREVLSSGCKWKRFGETERLQHKITQPSTEGKSYVADSDPVSSTRLPDAFVVYFCARLAFSLCKNLYQRLFNYKMITWKTNVTVIYYINGGSQDQSLLCSHIKRSGFYPDSGFFRNFFQSKPGYFHGESGKLNFIKICWELKECIVDIETYLMTYTHNLQIYILIEIPNDPKYYYTDRHT